MRRLLARLAWLLVLAGLAVAGVLAFRPRPVPVDLATVERGDLRLVVEEEGRTRVREPYRVTLPLAGRIERVALHAGDPVEAGRTLLVRLHPADPALLDERAVAQAEAAVQVAAARVEAAGAQVEQAREALRYARERVAVYRPMAREGAVAAEQLRALQHEETLATQRERSATLAAQVAAYEREQAQAALLHARGPRGAPGPAAPLELRAPVDGRVLRVLHEDEAALPAGAALLELGDVGDLEVVVEALTRDAVGMPPGAPVELAGWGGEAALAGRVRRVEPSAFTKVSALGVEEQRVRVVVDLDTPAAQRPALGDGFRVEARIEVGRRDGVLRVPSGALFRQGEGWAAFRAEQGRARLVAVQPGASDGRLTEVLAGLSAGEQVVAWPSDKVADGVELAPR